MEPQLHNSLRLCSYTRYFSGHGLQWPATVAEIPAILDSFFTSTASTPAQGWWVGAWDGFRYTQILQ